MLTSPLDSDAARQAVQAGSHLPGATGDAVLPLIDQLATAEAGSGASAATAGFAAFFQTLAEFAKVGTPVAFAAFHQATQSLCSTEQLSFSQKQQARTLLRVVAVGELAGHLRQYEREEIMALRQAAIAELRPQVAQGAFSIRGLARMVVKLEALCRSQALPKELIEAEIVNRTIGDIDLRRVTEREGDDAMSNYSALAEEMGIALPGEVIAGVAQPGETYGWLRQKMGELERRLLTEYHFDPRMYDAFGTGNLLLRGWLAQMMAPYGVIVPPEQVFLSLGAIDGIHKTLQGLSIYYHNRYPTVAMLCPEPAFSVPEWQAMSFRLRVHRFRARPEHRFNLTADELRHELADNPDIHIFYLTVSNNPTAFAYRPEELTALFAVIKEDGRELTIIADLAYIGTGIPEEDRERMAAFVQSGILPQTVFASSMSKVFTLTGDRMGWATIGSPELVERLFPAWSNSTASLPGEWQLRFMAYLELLRERPWLAEKLRGLYTLRRNRMIAQLEQLNARYHLFEVIGLDDHATVYNWSKLCPGEDVFTLFEKTGIVGVPGSAFGYTDDYIRFSVGIIPLPTAANLAAEE